MWISELQHPINILQIEARRLRNQLERGDFIMGKRVLPHKNVEKKYWETKEALKYLVDLRKQCVG